MVALTRLVPQLLLASYGFAAPIIPSLKALTPHLGTVSHGDAPEADTAAESAAAAATDAAFEKRHLQTRSPLFRLANEIASTLTDLDLAKDTDFVVKDQLSGVSVGSSNKHKDQTGQTLHPATGSLAQDAIVLDPAMSLLSDSSMILKNTVKSLMLLDLPRESNRLALILANVNDYLASLDKSLAARGPYPAAQGMNSKFQSFLLDSKLEALGLGLTSVTSTITTYLWRHDSGDSEESSSAKTQIETFNKHIESLHAVFDRTGAQDKTLGLLKLEIDQALGKQR